MKKVQRSSFKLNPIAASIVLAMASVNVANAGSGFGAGIDLNNAPVAIPTYYANSPVGLVPSIVAGVPQINATTKLPVKVDSGAPLRKFVDTLPGFGSAAANNLGQYIPVAVPEAWVDGNGVTTTDDYYEIAAVEYSEKMHSDLAKATHLRGYVQLVTPGLVAKGVTGISFTTLDGRVLNVVDNPHHLGPVINATSGKAVRVKFSNFLPVGAAGNLFLPVDTTITGAGLGPDGKTSYTQNRAEIHLVGGQNPWISAGSPHQWVAPAGEAAAYTAGLGKGVSTQNVPDMPDPGAGAVTLYFPNNQSARFMFYQDRTSGMTRLNAYAGLEAGYVITDPIEQGLVTSGVIPADQIPLIIEDKTFVPKNVAQQDAKWTWGAEGDLWFPHVYETNQDPTSIDGTNPVGRWDYGPWFWPIFAAPSGNLPAVSFTPEAFHDTPVINGTAYPSLTVDPKAYRFRILNASNDRFINLGLYQADTTVSAPQLDINGNPIFNQSGVQQFFTGTEVKMVPAVADVNGNPPGWDPVKGIQLPAPQYPSLATTQNIASSGPTQAWPVDNRIGGAPDPLTAGPDIIAIGNDGGLLPNPVDIPAQPITYEANRRSITVGNIYGYGLLLAPSERSDAIIDFSKYAGQTLILYNDAPAPVPFVDSRVDYFTGDPDQTTSGGAYSTQPGYGPNTRTMMQIKVNATLPGGVAPVAYTQADLPVGGTASPLATALAAAYKASQPTPIVPESVYNTAFGTTDGDTWAHVASGSNAQPNLAFSYTPTGTVDIAGINLIASGGANSNLGSGMGYLSAPLVQFNFPAAATCAKLPTATATVDAAAQVSLVKLTPGTGLGCTAIPVVTFVNTNGGVGAQATVVTTASSTNQAISKSIPVLTKAEQELFDNYGRYNSTGGVELPYTTAITQTTVPLNYIDAATEIIGDGEIQLWKFVDNGLWTNALRFDFVDVQLVNRVGWDGTVKPPASNEIGWKDTVRLNPLEDVIVAIRAKRPATPFGLPQSVRAMDPAVAAGASGSNMGFTVDPGVTSTAATGGTTPTTPLVKALAPLLTTAVNVAGVNYDNEYAWNSSILSHSENDLSRPVIFNPTVTAPNKPSGLALSSGKLAWIDPTPSATAATGSLNATLATNDTGNEIGFKVSRATYVLGSGGKYTPGIPAVIGNTLANVTSFTDTTPLLAGTDYAYTVEAWNAAGSTASDVFKVITPPVAATGLSATATYNSVKLSWKDNSNNETGYQIWRDDGLGGAMAQIGNTLAANSTSYTDSSVAEGSTYNYQVVAVNPTGTATSAKLAVTTLTAVPANPTGLTATPSATGTPVTLKWTDNATNESAYLIEVSTNGGTTYTKLATVPGSTSKGGTGTVNYSAAATLGVVNTYRVSAVGLNAAGNVAVSLTNVPAQSAALTATASLLPPVAPAIPTLQAPTINAANGAATLKWNAVTGATGYLVSVNGAAGVLATGTTTAGGTVSYIVKPALALGSSYSITVAAQNALYGSPITTSTSKPSTAVTVNLSAPAMPGTPGTLKATETAGTMTLSWGAVTNATGYLVSVNGGTATLVAGTSTTASGLLAGTNANNFTVQAQTVLFGSALTTTNGTASAQTNFTNIVAPTGVAASTPATLTTTTMLLKGTAATGATGYTVQWRSGTTGGWTTVGTTYTPAQLAAGITVTGLKTKTAYQFAISSVGPNGASAYSAAVTATTK
jgi:FtsP/CotA-like multicopper oxidase with cupredoxin domain